MYKEYEQKMQRLARILKVVKRVVIVLAIVVPVVLLVLFAIGFRYRALKCNSVVYGEQPEPKAYFTTIGEITYEYRPVSADDSEWSTDVPILPGEYEVRARMVSFLGIKKECTGKFEIRPKPLDIRLEDILVYDDPHTGEVTENDYEISGLEYDDRIQNVRIQIEENNTDISLVYHLEDIQIVHADGADAMDCYVIPEKTAEIRDDRVSITVAAGSRTMTYDGDPNAFRDYDEWKITSGALRSGHTAEFHCEASGNGKWHAINKIVSGGIKDADGNPVDYQYKIEYEDGKLELLKRKLSITSGSATKWYDGTPLTNPNYTVGGDGVAPGDTLTTECIGMTIEPAIIPNDFGETSIRSDRFGDVMEYYDVELITGKLKVLLRVDEPGTDVESPYIGNGNGNGPEVPDQGGNNEGGNEGGNEFIDGGELEPVILEFDKNRYVLPGADESAPYDPDAIVIDPTAESTIYVYDETASDVAFIDPTAESTIKALDESASDPGFIDPTAESTIPDGGESTEDGGGSTEDGGESTEDGGESTEDGGESTEDGGESTEDAQNKPSNEGSGSPVPSYSPSFAYQSGQPKKVFSFYGFSNRIYYFKIYSYGEYDGRGFTRIQGEDDYLPWSEYLMGNAILDSGYGYRDIVRVADLALNTMVYPYFMTTDLTKSEDSKMYTCETYFTWGTSSHPVSSDAREKEYRDFVYSAYMGVPTKVKEKLEELGKEAGLKEYDPDLVDKIAEYIQNAADYSFNFSFPANEDMVLYFLTKGKAGICQHYAAAATLMYRTYGIPARYVVGYAEQGQPGRWTTMTTNCAHAWVEVYIDGSGWIPVEVTGEPKYEEDSSDGDSLQFDWGTGDDEEFLQIDIVYDRYKKVYDGKKGVPVTLQGHLYSGRLRDGDRLIMPSVEVKDEEVLQRVGDNFVDIPLEEIKIIDPAGKDVTDDYVIGVVGGRYIVEARPLSIIVYGDYGERNSLWRMKRMQWSIADGSLASGHTLEVYYDDREEESDFAYTLGNVGDYKICARILDEEGNNVTYNYDLFSEVIMDRSDYETNDAADLQIRKNS